MGPRQSTTGPCLLDLVNDNLDEIRRHLSIRGRIRLRQTCRRLYGQDTSLVLPDQWKRPDQYLHDQRLWLLLLMREGFHVEYGHAELVDYLLEQDSHDSMVVVLRNRRGLTFKWTDPLLLDCTCVLTFDYYGHPTDDTQCRLSAQSTDHGFIVYTTEWWLGQDDRGCVVHMTKHIQLCIQEWHDKQQRL